MFHLNIHGIRGILISLAYVDSANANRDFSNLVNSLTGGKPVGVFLVDDFSRHHYARPEHITGVTVVDGDQEGNFTVQAELYKMELQDAVQAARFNYSQERQKELQAEAEKHTQPAKNELEGDQPVHSTLAEAQANS